MSRARYSRNWRGMAWIGGCLIFGAVAALRAYAETVLVVYSGGNKEVRQFSVANGVWTYEKVFASGSYEGKAMTPAGVTSDGRRVYIGDIAARRILAFETDGRLWVRSQISPRLVHPNVCMRHRTATCT